MNQKPLWQKIKKIFSDLGDKLPVNWRQSDRLDEKLVTSLASSRLPKKEQLKHLFKVLQPLERRLIKILIFVAIICLVIMGEQFYRQHIQYLPRAGGEYTEGLIGTPRFINPILAQTNDVDLDISRLVFASLLKYDQQGQLVPDLVESYKISEDQKNYTLTLKADLRWHDGQPLTADDILFTLASIQDPEFKSPLAVSFEGVGVGKLDDRTVRFSLSEPFAPFLDMLTFGILPKHIWQNIPAANAQLAEYNLKPIGSGPYQFVSITKDRDGVIKSYTLERNLAYHGQQPYIENLIFKFYPDFSIAVQALQNKKVQGISFLPKGLALQVTKNKNLIFYYLHLPQYSAIFFNQKNNDLLRDQQIRLALAYSIDKEIILQEALQREGEVIHGPILPGFVGYNPEIKLYEYNPEQANQLLTDRGWQKITPEEYQAIQTAAQEKAAAADTANKKTAADEETTESIEEEETIILDDELENIEIIESTPPFYRQKQGRILEISLTAVDQPESLKSAELIREYWQNIGIKVNLQIIPGLQIKKEVIKPRNYEALIYSEIIGSDPDPYPFWHSSQNQTPGLNLAIVTNKQVDKLLETARQTNDYGERQEKYLEFQNILAKELPAIFLYSPTYTYVVDKIVKGIDTQHINVPADRFANITNWYIKVKRRFK